jgi:hypothetical protein
MAMNTQPGFPHVMNVSWTGTITAANTTKDGTAGTLNLLFTAGADGSRIDQIKGRAKGTNVASVARFFVNNGQDPTVATNNSLAHEVTLPATTAIETAALTDLDITINKNTTETVCPIPYLPAGYRLYVVIGTAVSAGWQFTAWGGDY